MSSNQDDNIIKVTDRKEPRGSVNVTLKEIFIAHLSSTKLHVHPFYATSILQKDCNIVTSNLKPHVANFLIDGLIYYSKIWPGWRKKSEYVNGQVVLNVWYKQFVQYISYKCKGLFDMIVKHLDRAPKSNKITTQTQTDATSTNYEDCPYKLVIGGHPTIVNNIAILTRDENIYVKQHPIKSWTPLTLTQFLNWPFVAVELKLFDLHFERVNAHNFARYITINHSELKITDTNYITHIKKHTNMTQAYTYVFLKLYVRQLFDVLRKLEKIDNDHLGHLSGICEQFLEDIREMNINEGSMQTHTTVGFHIGNFKYFRQKQIVTSQKDQLRDNKTVINLVEIITPEVVCTLHQFNASQDDTDTNSVSFKSLNELTRQLQDSSSSTIDRLVKSITEDSLIYRCTFCNMPFFGHRALAYLTTHFADLHKVGHQLICHLCGGQFDMQKLVLNRWKHKCV